MKIRVELFLHFRQYAPEGSPGIELALPEGSTIEVVLELLGIPESQEKVILVDGRVRDGSHPLREGETLTIFPPLDGG